MFRTWPLPRRPTQLILEQDPGRSSFLPLARVACVLAELLAKH